MSPKLLITGATGNVGREVIRLLASYQGKVCAAVRDPVTAQQILNGDVEAVPFDFTQPSTFTDAFTDVKKLFLVRPPALSNVRTEIIPALEAAKQAGVEQIVFLSILGADRNRVVPHHAIERAIAQLSIPATFLRASFFMQNLNTTHREEIRQGELFLPAGNGKTSFIDVRDIAAVAVRALTEDGHQHQAYPLTGSEALTYYEVADIFTEVLGKPVRYRNPSLLQFLWRTRDRHIPLNFALIMAGIYTTARLGLAATVTDDTARLLQRPPITVRQYVEDYRSVWL